MKQIPNLNNYYITREGNIFSNFTGKLKPMRDKIDTSGYRRINLVQQGKAKNFLVHRLVAITYKPNPENLPVVKHLDDNKLNPHVDNLEWSTSGDNQRDAYTTGLKTIVGEENPKNLLTEVEVLEIYNFLLEGSRILDLSKKYNVAKGTIGSIKDRTNWNYLLVDLPPIFIKPKAKSMGSTTVLWVCNMLQEGVACTKIFNNCENKNISIDQIYDIKRRRTHKSISSKFHW